MKTLPFELKELCKRNRDGGHRTRAKRHELLQLIARQLQHDLGYAKMQSRSLKPKHVEALVKLWHSQDLATATIKQRMSALRWWAEKVHKQNVVARENCAYGIKDRLYLTKTSKAFRLEPEDWQAIQDPHVQASLRLAAAFGLRKEEAIKCIPKDADRGNELFLKASWCKGGKARSIPITSGEQRQALDRAKHIAKGQSLIPSQYSFVQQKKRYEHITQKAGLHRLHSLRHQYAQDRYLVLTGWLCPHQGGPIRAQLNAQQQKVDRAARLQISKELGHERLQIVATYLGR